MIKNKKAILLPEVLKIIIGVVCIVLLIYLAVKIYGILTVSSDLEKARATLDAIVGKANVVGEGETLNYLITAPTNWHFIQYASENKLCICPNEIDVIKQKATCLAGGVCQTYTLSSEVLGKCVLDRIVNCISFSKIPLAVKISKQKGIIEISNSLDYTSNNIIQQVMASDKIKSLIVQRADMSTLDLLSDLLPYKNTAKNLETQIVDEIQKFIPEEMKAENYGWDIRVWKNKETTASFLNGVNYMPPAGWKLSPDGFGSEFENNFAQGENSYKIKLTFNEYVKE